MRRIFLFLLLPLALSGCATVAMSSASEVGTTFAENRSFGRKVDDKLIYADIVNQYMQAKQSELISMVTFNVRFGRVMLTGIVSNEEAAQQAVALTWKAKGVQEVINELIVMPRPGLMNTANDSLIKRNLEARLFITKDVWVVNYSLDVEAGNAYLIGRVHNQGELDRVLAIAKTTKGIKRVVSHLQISTDQVNPTPAPADATLVRTIDPPATSSVPAPPQVATPIRSGPISQESTRPPGSR